MRGVYDRKGEQFAYLQGDKLFTVDGEPTGYLRGEYIVDLQDNRVWQLVGDGLHSLDGSETIGYIGPETQPDYDY